MDLAPLSNDTSGIAANPLSAVYLYFYTDSVAFPRLRDQSVDQTWPFLLAEAIRARIGVPVFPCVRGLGGGTITEIGRILNRDVGYFRAQGDTTRSIVIFNIGVVDAAPQPFTYGLRKIARIPRIGSKIWTWMQARLQPHRALLQRIYSFRRSSPSRFSSVFNRMVRLMTRAGMFVVSIDTPLTPLSLEARSPGLRDSIARYNQIKHECAEALHVSTDWAHDEHFLECGHHFNLEGHRQLADRLMLALRPLISPQEVTKVGQ